MDYDVERYLKLCREHDKMAALIEKLDNKGEEYLRPCQCCNGKARFVEIDDRFDVGCYTKGCAYENGKGLRCIDKIGAMDTWNDLI